MGTIRIFLLLLAVVSVSAQAEKNFISGEIAALAVGVPGLQFMLSGSVKPDECSGYGWLTVDEANKTMISVVLAMWVSGNKTGKFYVADNSCKLTYIDPTN